MNDILKELTDLADKIEKLSVKVYRGRKDISNLYDFTQAEELSDKLFKIQSDLRYDCYTLAVAIWGMMKMMIPKSIIVKYSGFDERGLYYSNTLEFRTERDADLFILDMKKLMFGVQSYTKIITWGKKEEITNE